MQYGVVTVVDHYTNACRLADAPYMLIKPFLRRIDQIMRQKQNSIGTGLFSRLGDVDGNIGAIAATGYDCSVACCLLGCGNDCRNFGR
jgi:hypothetical protein